MVGMIATGLLAGVISMKVLMPRDEVEVPNVLAKDLLGCWKALQSAGLVPYLEKEMYHDAIDAGRVISQSPLPGTPVKKGRPVRVVVSQGYELSPVPSLVDLTQNKAEVAARNQGFEMGSAIGVHSRGILAGRVLAQSPSSGVNAPRGSLINVVLSQGPRSPTILMPDLLGRSANEARRMMEVLRMSDPVLEQVASSSEVAGTVIAQSPGPGAITELGTKVTLTVAGEPSASPS